MTLIVGLGNPGRKYSNTKHNIGFMVVDKLAEKYSFTFHEIKDYLISKGSIEGKEVAIVKPTTFMNLSGIAVKKLLNDQIKENLPNSLIVVQDDIDLPLGKIKIKRNGSSGGHRGIKSIIDNIGTKDFIRVKIGIGKKDGVEVSEYVLSSFSKEEKSIIKRKILQSTEAIVTILTEGLERAMNIYNREDL